MEQLVGGGRQAAPFMLKRQMAKLAVYLPYTRVSLKASNILSPSQRAGGARL